MLKNKYLAGLVVLALTLGLSAVAVVASPVVGPAVAGDEDVCDKYGAADHLYPENDSTYSITYTAPPGYLISAYCVKAGSIHHTSGTGGPQYELFDPPVASVTITHDSVFAISHYSILLVTDVCSNIPGAQSTVPSGYTQNLDGTCSEDGPESVSGQPTTETQACLITTRNWITLPAVSGGAWVITLGAQSAQHPTFDGAPPFGYGAYTLELIDLDADDLFAVQEASFPYTAVDKKDLPCVTAGDPTFVPAVCNATGSGITAGSYTVVEVTGVRYEKSENGGAATDIDPGTYYVSTFPTTITITAFAIDPNELVNDPATWSYEFVSPGACIDNDASAELTTLPATCVLPERIVYVSAVNATWSPVTPPTGSGTLVVTANANAGHTFAGGATSLELFNGTLDPVVVDPECDLPTEGLATPSYSSTPLTCTADGSFTVGGAINGQYVNWFRAGTPGVLPFGTYAVSSAQTVVLTAVSTDPIHHGLVDINSNEWVNPVVLEFTEPTGCDLELTTLALTGTGAAIGGLSLAGGFVFLGVVALYMRRKAALRS